MGVILILMTICGLVIAAILLIFARATKKSWLETFVLGGIATWMSGYIILLFIGSFFSVERTLAFNEPKQYCGFYLDCHMHTAVTHTRTERTIGNRTANGIFYVVNVKVFSDAKNPNIALHLIEPKARVVLANGDKIERDGLQWGFPQTLATAPLRCGSDAQSGEGFREPENHLRKPSEGPLSHRSD